jgi:hypothetical protein
METSKAEPLDAAAATLSDLIQLMQDCGLRDTAHFLAMAKTQLLIELNGISDSEFRALCDWLEGRQAPERRDATAARTRRDGSLRAMHRAWQCPQDVPAGRGRRRAAAASRT